MLWGRGAVAVQTEAPQPARHHLPAVWASRGSETGSCSKISVALPRTFAECIEPEPIALLS